MHKVTRPVSSTCLDHVYTTHPGFVNEISVPDSGLSDHLPVFIRRKYSKKQRDQTHSTIEYRDFKNLNANELLHDLECTPWDIAFVFDDLNDVLITMETMLNDVLDRHIPLKSKRVKKPNQPAWMTKEILSSMKTRDKLLKTARISNLHADWQCYTHAKGKTTSLIKKAKRSFFPKKIDENKENPKGVLQALKILSGTSKPRVRIHELNTGNNIINDEASIANVDIIKGS